MRLAPRSGGGRRQALLTADLLVELAGLTGELQRLALERLRGASVGGGRRLGHLVEYAGRPVALADVNDLPNPVDAEHDDTRTLRQPN
jgi:hypothetical protein